MMHGHRTNLWTTARIAELIRREFGVQYHRDHVGRLMHALNWSPQKPERRALERDRKSTRLNSSHGYISYAVFCLKKKKHYTISCNQPNPLHKPSLSGIRLAPNTITLPPSGSQAIHPPK